MKFGVKTYNFYDAALLTVDGTIAIFQRAVSPGTNSHVREEWSSKNQS